MQKTLKPVLKNFLLIVVIFFLLWLGYLGFIGGPAQAYKKEDRFYMDAIAEHKKLDSARLIQRFALDRVYYVIEAIENGESSVAWFDTDFKDYKTYSDVALSNAYDLAQELGLSNKDVSYGVYDMELVYIIKDKKFNVYYVDVETLEVIYFDGGR